MLRVEEGTPTGLGCLPYTRRKGTATCNNNIQCSRVRHNFG